ncbi:MAG: stage II sporulation protein M [Pseudomonadota bacterium]
MIISLEKFVNAERPFWTELETVLGKMEGDPLHTMSLKEIRRFHYLYQRTSSDLAWITTFASESEIRKYLESIVSRAYSEVHETREKRGGLPNLRKWIFRTFPHVVRSHIRILWVAVAVMTAGVVFGGLAISLDPESREVLLPFAHLMSDPSERVAREEGRAPESQAPQEDRKDKQMEGGATFSAFLVQHNTRVSIFLLALGMTWGVGTIIMLFYNGVILGAVIVDYVLAGESEFLAGWLLPHGALEIPAVLLAGQAGLLLGSALIGWGKPLSLRDRLKEISKDLVTLIAGVALMLIWAGLVEAFLSQCHEPAIPYPLKIGFGLAEVLYLLWFFGLSGRDDGLRNVKGKCTWISERKKRTLS